MRVSQFNSHEVTVPDGRQNFIVAGVAVNPSLAMANHSCDSNYGRVWTGEGGAVAFATRPIGRNEEITDCYHSHDGDDADERRMALSRYLFECQCVACVQNWPSKLPKNVKGLPDSAYLDKSHLKKLDSLGKKFWKGEQKLDFLKTLTTLACSTLRRPHGLLMAVEEALHRALWVEYGRKE